MHLYIVIFFSIFVVVVISIVTGLILYFSDMYPSQYCNPPPSHNDQQQTTEIRPLGQTVSYPSDTTIVARGFYTPYMNENNPNTDTKSYSGVESSSPSGRHLQSRNVPASGSQSSINRPLPPVPH